MEYLLENYIIITNIPLTIKKPQEQLLSQTQVSSTTGKGKPQGPLTYHHHFSSTLGKGKPQEQVAFN